MSWNTLYAQEKTNERDINADSILRQGVTKVNKGAYKEALADFNDFIQLEKHSKEFLKFGDAYSYMGIIYTHLGRYDQAIQVYKKSQLNYKKADHLKGLANVTNNIGSIYYFTGDYLNTLKFYRESLEYRKVIKDTNGLAIVTQNIGLLFSKTGDFQEAQRHYEEALTIFKQLDMSKSAAETLSNIGYVLIEQGHFKEAKERLNRALIIANKQKNRQLRLRALSNLAELALKQSLNEEAATLFLQTLMLADSLDSPRYQSEAQIALGKLDITSADSREAEKHCTIGLKIAEKMQSVSLQRDAYDCLYQSYKNLGNPEKSLYAYERSNYFQDQLKTDETANRLLGMQFKNQQLADSLAHAQKEHALQLAHQIQIRKKERQRNGVIVSLGFIVVVAGGLLSRLNFVRKSKRLIEFEKQRSDDLLLNILPAKIAEELKGSGQVQAQGYEQVAVLFTDFKSFTKTAQNRTPQEIVEELNVCFMAFDTICETYQIEKIKTIGDAYMAVGGIPIPHQDAPARIVKAGLAMQEFMSQRQTKNRATGSPVFEMRVGIHTGPLIAGVVGLKKFQYDVWGDTVNTASRMESSSLPGKVNISQPLYILIKNHPDFSFECRGNIAVKGKGNLMMYFVEEAKNYKKKEDKMIISVVG